MPPHDVLEWIEANPFTPFRIRLTDGRSFEIRAPYQMLPGRQSAVVGIPSAEDPRLYERHNTISLLHVVSIEPIDATAKAS